MRPGTAVPPHHIWNAPTVPRSAASASAISRARARARPPARHIDHSPMRLMADGRCVREDPVFLVDQQTGHAPDERPHAHLGAGGPAVGRRGPRRAPDRRVEPHPPGHAERGTEPWRPRRGARGCAGRRPDPATGATRRSRAARRTSSEYFACSHGSDAVDRPSSRARHGPAGAGMVVPPAVSPGSASRIATVAATMTASAAGISG